jgi:hypothetical protein
VILKPSHLLRRIVRREGDLNDEGCQFPYGAEALVSREGANPPANESLFSRDADGLSGETTMPNREDDLNNRDGQLPHGALGLFQYVP